MWEAIGLSAADEDVYRAVLAEPDRSAGGYAAALALPVDAVRPALRRLAAAGLVERGPAGYRAHDPRPALGSLVNGRRAALDKLAAVTDELSDLFAESRLRTGPSELTEIIEGRDAIHRRLRELESGATTEVLALDTPPYVTGRTDATGEETDLLARGVRVRAIYAVQALTDAAKVAHVRALTAAGEQARVLPQVPMKLVLVDAGHALMPLTGVGIESAIVVRRSALTEALHSLFALLWRQAVPFETGARPGDLDRHERALLRLLNAGLKDETIARQLGVSERTLRRRVTSLLERLGATSRFQAGAQAIRRGWL